MRLHILVAAGALALSACDAVGSESTSADATAAGAEARSATAGADGLAAVRRATAQYQNVDRAVADGYGAVVVSECVEAPPGGMGYHYVNLGLMDGTVEASAPEVVLYEPQKNGRLRLVAVEYIVPVADFDDPGPAPEPFGQTFHLSGAAGGWALHAWVWKHNPSGTFADFNPDVSCEYD